MPFPWDRINDALRFTHRRRDDGSWDSICMSCMLTVANADARELAAAEAVHACDLSNRDGHRASGDEPIA